ncbi:MAG: type II secretion system protein [Oscillospiraceae bacterium]|nr:type II secretion system protein [Oscillospiraceae bacterium]
MKQNHRGFTLVELLVVMAILGICAALATISLSAVSSARAQKCATAIDAMLSEAKVAALSKDGNSYLALYEKDGKIYAALHAGGSVEEESVGGQGVTVTYAAGGVTYSLGGAGAPLYLAFNRETGALRSLREAAALVSAAAAAAAPEGELTAITAKKGASCVIKVASATGYHGIGG